MRGARRGIFLCAAALALSPGRALVTGCSSNGETCDCPDPGITIDVPPDIASSIPASGVRLSGTACTGVTATVANATNGGSQYRFDANAAGTCHIEVDSALGTFTDDITVVAGTSCCSGFFASPITAGEVQVPELGDAG